ncbi:ISAzo13-like element transposase-related protein [Catenuloplanes atrovinosus]|uniref:DNA-binding phage protein n=1 Tax=Catenuloplanes atrovinosus TaxID=137266 RepID=A0AAE3YRC2_9ACTN|nr:hypothetical protein [Catenuloplanes atrovinosus]MDR7276924.1 DNA-binding phage protein [Catenuloplanes atrovinosus]
MRTPETTAEHLLTGLAAELSAQLSRELDERQRRLVLGARARLLGRGGIALVARAAGVNRKTVARGVAELDEESRPAGRVRARGAGRRTATEADEGLERALWRLIEPRAAGAGRPPLRWTTSSVRRLTDALHAAGHPVSTWTVHRLLRAHGFRPAGARRGRGPRSAGDREGRFRRLGERAADFLGAGDPVVCLTAWADTAPDGGSGRCRVPVGGDRETAVAAVAALRRWWSATGALEHPGARRLLVVVDDPDTGEDRSPWLRAGCAALASDGGPAVTVGHLPPGISRWNRLERRVSERVALGPRGGLLVVDAVRPDGPEN